ncbi:hypothetical protein LJC34_01635 [Oscillospiraceae bacterium OttesenSCG-928-G22]|nr:hypothetical protein [Oscillospiraceae bacterium OttesenSCG-928-G22]
MKQFWLRVLKMAFGILLYSFAAYLCIQANVGLAPWSAFSMGISIATGIQIGTASVLTGFVFLILAILLKEKIGLGTLFDVFVFGKFIDLFRWIGIVPLVENTALGIALLLLGQCIVAVASYFYISPGLGSGPRDSLMVFLGKRFPRLPIGLVRGLMEGTALLIGWRLGAKIGIGTVIAVFGIGFILQLTFKVLKFDVTSVKHENLLTSVRRFLPRPAPSAPAAEADLTAAVVGVTAEGEAEGFAGEDDGI